VVVSLGWPSGPFWCDGTIDTDVTEGDWVEVYGILYEMGDLGWFNACQFSSYYVKRLGADVSGQVLEADGGAYDGGDGLYGLAYLCPSGEDWSSSDCESAEVTRSGGFALGAKPGDYTLFIACGQVYVCADACAEEEVHVETGEDVSTTIYLPFTLQDIEFEALVLNTPIGAPGSYVEIQEVLSGPSISGQVRLVSLEAWPATCDGTVEPHGPGDTIKVKGAYYEWEAYRWVNVCVSSEYFVENLSAGGAAIAFDGDGSR
jgi:hypothetical protein